MGLEQPRAREHVRCTYQIVPVRYRSAQDQATPRATRGRSHQRDPAHPTGDASSPDPTVVNITGGKATSDDINDPRTVLEGLLKELGTSYVDMCEFARVRELTPDLIHSPLVSMSSAQDAALQLAPNAAPTAEGR